MLRTTGKLLGLFILVVAGSAGIIAYHNHFSAERKIEKLEDEKKQLAQIVKRLGEEKRVAEVLVENQQMVDGELQTTLLFVEYARDGTTLPPKSFTFVGKMAHIDAMVIKFDRGFIEAGDALRGNSIALFTRIYGDKQSPAEAAYIDEPGTIPAVYRGADPRVSRFEMELWQNFWKLAEDPAYRKKHGVRVANGQGVWGPFEPDKIYTITIESDGGLNMSSEPLRGIYREALKRKTTL
ncbi:MAG TPA: hypothetical protein VGR35_10100 [Tepidisphaeraceae bacterium]|nr:hypothetical protein [Tepidisphaeraceae bacterium]